MTEPRMGLRVKVLATLVLVMFATLTTRLWFLQVLAAEQYKEDAKDNAVRLIEVPAPRGVINDANGDPLVDNRASVVITINRQALGDDTERVLFDLSQLLDVPADELGSRLDDPRYYVFSPIPVAIDVPRRIAYYIKEHKTDFPGVDVLQVPCAGTRRGPWARTSSGTSARYPRRSSRTRVRRLRARRPGRRVGVESYTSATWPERRGWSSTG